MEKKKTKLTISGSSKKTISNIELAKSKGKNSVIIEKKLGRFRNKPRFPRTDKQETLPLNEAIKKISEINKFPIN